MTEYLHATGRLAPTWTKTRRTVIGGSPVPASFEAALGEPMAAFEKRFREWLLPPRRGLVRRLLSAPQPTEDAALLRYVDDVRKASQGAMHVYLFVPLLLDPSLSSACAKHAVYLHQNPDQLSKWPDAHREYPDREGFTPEGCWAGAHSVIVPQAKDHRQAIDMWLATFYHRLPLLAPGLVCIGWGHEHEIAVLDADSMTGVPARAAPVMWPAPGATDVPLRFVPELPNPFPEEDQSRWGYPVTLQIGHFKSLLRPEMALYAGRASAATQVDCLVTSPAAPGNPDLAPEGAYGLIPRGPLEANTTYVVVVKGLPPGVQDTWSFETGS